MGKLNIISGQKFNRLTIIEEVERHIYPSGRPRRRFLCKCDCGNQTTVMINKILNGHTNSCGCYRKENSSILGKTKIYSKENNKSYKHGLSNHQLYSTWIGMKNRCNNPNSSDYKHYGGRGIKICDRWNNSFPNFLEDMGMKPSKSYSIDRIDVNGNYELNNCKWSTQKEQVKNRR